LKASEEERRSTEKPDPDGHQLARQSKLHLIDARQNQKALACRFRRKAATYSNLIAATVPI
jgi:hypothetical protein